MQDIARREFILKLARRCLGVSVLPALTRSVLAGGTGQAAVAAAADAATGGKAKSVIYLFMSGGMSHLDTFDPKPDNKDVQGPVGAIRTREAGVRLTEWLPKLAAQTNQYAMVRSVHHTQGNHQPGQYKLRTGYELRPDLTHPSLGAWAMKLGKRLNPSLPGYVRVGGLAGHPAHGFFEVSTAPLPILKPDAGLQNGRLRDGMTRAEFDRNLDLAHQLDEPFVQRYQEQPAVRAYSDLYDDAVRMMTSKDLDAFDLRKEPADLRERYGKTNFGAGCMLARRLVERGVRFIEVDHGGWDTHVDNHKGVREACGPMDDAVAALLNDLEARGLLASTLVVLATEFGRTPEIDQNAGRNHHPAAYTCLLAGGGVQGGRVYGETDDRGHAVKKDPVTVLDFNATIAHAMGLPLHEALAPAAGGQRFSIAGKDTQPDKGKPIAALF